MTDFEHKTVEDVCKFLSKEVPELEESVFDNIRKHRVNGDIFIQLNDESLRELAPLLGDRIRLKRVISSILEPSQCDAANSSSSEPCSTHGSSVYSSDRSSLVEDTKYTVPSLKRMNSFYTPTHVHSDKWTDSFTIPSTFSRATMQALDNNCALLPSARNEIVDSLSTHILVHTRHPSSSQLEKVAAKLVQTYPNIADKVPGGSTYASWKQKLQNKFKNLNRPERAEAAGLTFEVSPAKKKMKMLNDSPTTSPSTSQLAEYRRHQMKMKTLYNSGKWNEHSMFSMLSETYAIRRHWITTTSPDIAVIMEDFPCLKEPSLLLHDFQSTTGGSTSKMLFNCKRLLEYAAGESKKDVKHLMKLYSSISDPTEDQIIIFALSIATSLSTQRGKGKPVIFLPIQGQYIDIDKALSEIKQVQPLVVGFGEDLITLREPKVVIEQSNVFRMPSFRSAVEYCLAAYFVFHIQYESNSKAMMTLLEFLYGISSCTMGSKNIPLVIRPVIEGLL